MWRRCSLKARPSDPDFKDLEDQLLSAPVVKEARAHALHCAHSLMPARDHPWPLGSPFLAHPQAESRTRPFEGLRLLCAGTPPP